MCLSNNSRPLNHKRSNSWVSFNITPLFLLLSLPDLHLVCFSHSLSFFHCHLVVDLKYSLYLLILPSHSFLPSSSPFLVFLVLICFISVSCMLLYLMTVPFTCNLHCGQLCIDFVTKIYISQSCFSTLVHSKPSSSTKRTYYSRFVGVDLFLLQETEEYFIFTIVIEL